MSDGLAEALGPDLMNRARKTDAIAKITALPLPWYERRQLFGRWCLVTSCVGTQEDFARAGPRPPAPADRPQR